MDVFKLCLFVCLRISEKMSKKKWMKNIAFYGTEKNKNLDIIFLRMRIKTECLMGRNTEEKRKL